MPVLIPHLALPLRFADGRAVVVEQDSADEIAMCLEAVARTTAGERVEAPDFGVPEELFAAGGIDLDALRDALVEGEPRAEPIVDRIEDPADVHTDNVRILLEEE